jgi:hypothetical protein
LAGAPEASSLPEDRLEPKKHNPMDHKHGQMYRAKMVPYRGPTEYGAWFCTESELRAALQGQDRKLGTRYYCEAKPIGCSECEVDEHPKVICAL